MVVDLEERLAEGHRSPESGLVGVLVEGHHKIVLVEGYHKIGLDWLYWLL